MNEMENNTTGAPVENTPSQTLFRFVSLRSPELSDDTKQDKRFIVIPQDLKNDNAFYVPVVNGTGLKQKLLQACAANYVNNPERISTDPNSLNSLEGFKRTYKSYYVFGTWLAKNKNTCTYEEVIAKRSVLIDPQAAPMAPPMISLWNNLIYQVVTQKDFYVKEVVMQQLLAHHILSVSNEEQMKTALEARVVLPKELMIEDDAISTSQAVSRMVAEGPKETFPTEEMKRQQFISAAKIKIDKYEALKKNLSTIERLYKAEYQKEYTVREEAYQNEIAPIIEEYNREVIANRDRYCQVRNPDVKYDPADPCHQIPSIPEPVLPKFNFQFRPEIEADSLLRAIKPENLDALFDVLGYNFQTDMEKERSAESNSLNLNNLLEGRNTFSEIDFLVKEAVERSNNIIVENTDTDNETYSSIGGVFIPVARTIAVPFTYQICPKYVHQGFTFDMALTVPDSSWEVNNISYTLTPNNGSSDFNSDYFMKSRSGNTIFLNDLCMPGLDFNTIQDASLSIKVMFTNGKLANIYANKLQARSCLSDKFLLEVEEDEPVKTDDENNFIPSGFGFKQIGIADYLKVEQTTHAYVEGEVAHIENIMAREYREKSTRRLRRSENTTTTSSDTEREQLTDTTTATRFEMQNEIAKMMQEASDSNTQFGVNASYDGGRYNINTSMGLGNASHSSRDESTRQATTQAQDITSRAMDRIVTKVHEERIEKIIEEFEENNSHGFDNKKGDKHVVGVYRWVDKLMKNQIYDYGKRMMFEFMIPEPAKLHLLGMTKSKFVKPEDPRTSDVMPMKDFTALSNETTLKYWISKYNVEIENFLQNNIKVTKGFAYGRDKSPDMSETAGASSAIGLQDVVKIPEGYISTEYSISGGGKEYVSSLLNINIADQRIVSGITTPGFSKTGSFVGYTGDVSVSISTDRFYSFETSLSISCILTEDAKKQWQLKTFKAIIDAYEIALIEYNNAVSEEENKASAIKDSNPNFYRQIENTVLRKNCISYMSDRAANSIHGYGLSGLTQGSSFTDYETKLFNDLDQYTAFVKFMEQAFEWENLSYYLYPYYWGNKQNWSDLYKAENTDPVFKAFLQSGMARVIATVRPGFENAVQFYLATGKIWNGGEVPVIGDDLYLSIVDEMKQPKGKKHGKAWITRLPTTLNILQAESIGLKVAHALPFTTENPDDFEVPSEVITEDKFNFTPNNNLLGVESLEGQKVISGDWK
ncbi:hypothetical protein [Chryseobacterium sp.]|jgi:hypothetical protein|uniref:hypothetical protein n=1 Tax=Chryseobacterium sp. TaxID=1871047 RepID=UPI0028504237|nr:hypothetical protein [Chryseobacterium sp.]MDR3024202.1 hypothetical protein [Chryseobacterium sp.]